MNKSNKKPQKEIKKLSDAELIALVASQIKGRILFPRLVESCRQILERSTGLK